MYLAAYHYEGDPARLLLAYDRLREHIPDDQLIAHLAVVTATGLTVIDACPDEAAYRAFVADPQIAQLFSDCGLPPARLEPLGPVHRAFFAAHASV